MIIFTLVKSQYKWNQEARIECIVNVDNSKFYVKPTKTILIIAAVIIVATILVVIVLILPEKNELGKINPNYLPPEVGLLRMLF